MASHWLNEWKPEDDSFWNNTGKAIAWRTLRITTVALLLSFSTWYLLSAVVVMLPKIGFKFTDNQLFWLAAMPGLAAGLLRICHMFLVPIYGTRNVITTATFLKLIPCIGIGVAVMNRDTPFAIFMILAFLSGFGGGDFSSFMPSTSFFFPKKMQGTALGIQAGIGNFGVSVVQFVTPWIIGAAAFSFLSGDPQEITKQDGTTGTVWLQNAAFIYVPFLLIVGFIAWRKLKSIPVVSSFKEQFDIFNNKHTWFCTITYVMTFGAFSGLAAAFPMLIKTLYGGFENAPNPLHYAFLGPLIGSASRVLFGPLTDKFGGAILTHITGIALIICCGLLVALGCLTPTSLGQFPAFLSIMLAIFFFTGIGNAATFRQYPIIFSHSPRQAAGVIGFTAAIAAFGPFIYSTLIGTTMKLNDKNPAPFFIGLIVYFVIATAINWWYYTRKGCEKPS